MAQSISPSGIDVSAQAAVILEQPRNAYWRPRAPDIRVDAIAFEAPAFLAGPFDERYGLVYVAHTPQAKPLQQLLDETACDVLSAGSTVYLSYAARQRIHAQYPDGMELHWDPVGREAYSELDVPHLLPDVFQRLQSTGQRCAEFANTVAGRATLFASLTAQEHAEHRQALENAVVRVHAEMRRTERCAERPFSVRLQGNDDASWTATCADLDEVDALVSALRTQGYQAVRERMSFTN